MLDDLNIAAVMCTAPRFALFGDPFLAVLQAAYWAQKERRLVVVDCRHSIMSYISPRVLVRA